METEEEKFEVEHRDSDSEGGFPSTNSWHLLLGHHSGHWDSSRFYKILPLVRRCLIFSRTVDCFYIRPSLYEVEMTHA